MSIEESSLLQDTLKRSEYFQNIQVWPLNNKLNYEGWLSNFHNSEDKRIACLILDFFIYYPDIMVNQMFKDSVSKSSYIFKEYFADWKQENFYNRCIYSHIPGENPNPTDSGYLFARKLRDFLSIPEKQIVDFKDLATRLDELGEPTPILFVDDFVGSGTQVYKAWNNTKIYNGQSLKELISSGGHCAVYTPLIINSMGYELIIQDCKELNICASHILGSEYNLLDPSCICWKGDTELFKKGKELIFRKSTELGIPNSYHSKTYDREGYLGQGLAISFEHGTPDAVLPIFYWKNENWKPLVQKTYSL